jgi:hypothetical protein
MSDSDSDSMSIISHESPAEDEVHPVTVLPTIELSFGKSKAWDDRALVNAYDAAMEEFHVRCSFTKPSTNANDIDTSPGTRFVAG